MPTPEEVAADYFGQSKYYFSESAKELISIEHMVPQYALNAWTKLYREHGEAFLGSALSDALGEHVMPSSDALSDVLTRHGKASVLTVAGGVSVNAARKRLRRAGASETHKHGEWVEGTMAPVQVTVKRKREDG